ncbi:MAG: hypothetical protein QMD36_01220 [Candidatus Aenigmarchaeota archaeon]|nr:hypothetical protein [Candidatus Aenigmarchaeota archaeon]
MAERPSASNVILQLPTVKREMEKFIKFNEELALKVERVKEIPEIKNIKGPFKDRLTKQVNSILSTIAAILTGLRRFTSSAYQTKLEKFYSNVDLFFEDVQRAVLKKREEIEKKKAELEKMEKAFKEIKERAEKI